ncbi:hypothetical protein ACIP2Z_12840 [Streptomyces iakyrus]|uniref:Uncharacterized protein n=1 Tax=Streptomyces iakyrus TaxID=68219 RepID=A0ABW8FCX2_9ACTN
MTTPQPYRLERFFLILGTISTATALAWWLLSFPMMGSYDPDRIITAQENLTVGLLEYSSVSNTKPGETLPFHATLYGSPAIDTPTPKGHKRKPYPAGAIVGARLNCSGSNVKCVSNSSEKKPVLRGGDKASWSWTIETPKAGYAEINLTITAYLDNTSTVIAEQLPVRQRIEIEKKDEGGGFFAFVSSFWKEVLAALTALGGLGGLLALRQARRSNAEDPIGDDSQRTNGATSSDGRASQSVNDRDSNTNGTPPASTPPSTSA